ncbi:transposase [Moorena sp. SIO4E2]|uniref:transposase n=1 Tax=Moorena sp. SIO4E2 TaxID=2607826 RepID=UPI00257C693F|nr:transposase [Moorena sp. SIO4E2]
MLEISAAVGEICLKYLDESGFSLWAETLYTWMKIGTQKRIEQGKKKGKRLNICGLLERGKSFEYGLAFKSFKSGATPRFFKALGNAHQESES